MTDRIPLKSQIDALWGNVVSRQSYLEQAEKLMRDPKHAARISYEFNLTKSNQPALEAGLETLRFLEANSEAFLAFMAERRGA